MVGIRVRLGHEGFHRGKACPEARWLGLTAAAIGGHFGFYGFSACVGAGVVIGAGFGRLAAFGVAGWLGRFGFVGVGGLGVGQGI
jgi:hypothetical protein